MFVLGGSKFFQSLPFNLPTTSYSDYMCLHQFIAFIVFDFSPPRLIREFLPLGELGKHGRNFMHSSPRLSFECKGSEWRHNTWRPARSKLRQKKIGSTFTDMLEEHILNANGMWDACSSGLRFRNKSGRWCSAVLWCNMDTPLGCLSYGGCFGPI